MTKAKDPLLQFVRRAVPVPPDQWSDGQLLERFLHQRNEEAFALLVQRHGSMVMGVCRRVLHHAQDAEDAFQATFLVLLRKADSIRPREKVGPWLYGVACRTSLEAKTLRAKRQVKEAQASPASHADEQPDRDLKEMLDQQIHALPEKYRLPILLCDLESKTQAEVAQQLGWPEGTVSGRLFRGRQMLARRLKKQGIAVTALTLSALLAETSWASPVPGSLSLATMKSARDCAFKPMLTFGSDSSQVPNLVEGVLRAMRMKQLKLTLIAILVMGISLGAIGMTVKQLLAAPPKPSPDKRAESPSGQSPSEKKPMTAKQLFQSMENRLLKAETVQCRVSATVGASNMKLTNSGTIMIRKPNQVRFESAWDMPEGKNMTLSMISDGKQIFMQTVEAGAPKRDEQPDEAPKHMREMLLLSLSRSGLIIPFTVGQAVGPNEAPKEPDPQKLFRISKQRVGKDEKLGEETVKVLHYECELEKGNTKFEVKVWLNPKTSLPLKRALVSKNEKVNEGNKVIKITETYSDWVLGKPMDAKLFEIPKKK